MSKRSCCPTGIAGRVRDGDRLILLQRTRGRGYLFGKGAPRNALEIRQGRIAPPLRLLFLNAEICRGFSESLRIHERSKGRPGEAHLPNVVHPARVVNHQLIPKRMTGDHGEIPGKMVKPEQVLLGGERWVVEGGCERRRILRGGV